MTILITALGHALWMAFAMFWEILWPLILGFGFSGAVQAVVSKGEMSRLLPNDSPKTLAMATGLGAASSSCSYAAVALARSVFRAWHRKHLAGITQREPVFLFNVSRLKIVAASVLLLAWIPATSLCLAEKAGVIREADHCEDSPSSQASACCVLASGAYKADDNSFAVVPGFGHKLSLVQDTFDVHPRLGASLAQNRCEAPPELRSSWQFCIRAAANPRAPSYAS